MTKARLLAAVVSFAAATAWLPPVAAADTAASTATATATAAAWDTCAGCHADLVRNFAKTPHAASPAGCQGCHGPTDEHVANGGDPTKVRQLKALSGADLTDVCLACHHRGEVARWDGSTHQVRALDCASCHDPHPRTAQAPEHLLKNAPLRLCGQCHAAQQARVFKSAHMPLREGKMTCTTCHNPHGTLNERLLRQHSVSENCFTCHAEKRGPFLWEHPPVRENCATCHDPHGSTQPNMLRVKVPLLCQNCHIGSRHPSQTHMPAERFSFGKGCVNCHAMVHGSNHPSGDYLLR